MTARPSVLFVCVHNAGRSQMAAGWLRELAGDRIEVRSAGSAPADSMNPAAVEAMAEVGGVVWAWGAAHPGAVFIELALMALVINSLFAILDIVVIDCLIICTWLPRRLVYPSTQAMPLPVDRRKGPGRMRERSGIAPSPLRIYSVFSPVAKGFRR